MLAIVPLPVSAKISPVPISAMFGCKIIEHSCGSAKADEHHTIGGNRHTNIGNKELIEAGQELHYHAGNKIVINAGQTLTATGGGSFLKLDASGVTLVGPTVNIIPGGSPGKWTAVAPKKLLGIRMFEASMQHQPIVELCQEQPDGTCPLTDCPCDKYQG